MRHHFLASLIVGIFLSLNASAADLMQVYNDALVNDSQFASARSALTAGQEKITQGRANLLPNLSGSGGYNRVKYEHIPYTSDTNYRIALTQPLFNWAYYQNYEQSKLLVSVSEAQFSQAQQNLIIRTAQAYFDVLTAEDILVFAQAQKAAILEQLKVAKRSFEVGTVTITDTHEAQARYDLADAQEFAATSDLEIRRAALQQIIGKPPAPLAPLRPGVAINQPVPNALEPWVTFAETQNYSVIESQFSLEIAKRAISLNRAGHYPTVDLVASHYRSNNGALVTTPTGGIQQSNNTNAIGVQWNLPLFSGFAVTSRVREAIALEDKARNDFETARRNAAQLAREAYLGLNSGLSQVRALEAAEVSSLSALEANKLGYEVGIRIIVDVLNAQQQVFSTRRDLTIARHNAIMNSLRLKQAAGILQESDIERVNRLLRTSD